MASENQFMKFVYKNRALPNDFALKCLEIQLEICSHGKSAQDLIRNNGTLLKLKRIFRMCQKKRETYLAVSPCFLNVFWSCVCSPVNQANQNQLRCFIPDIITVLNYLRNKRCMKKHKCGHWILLQGLLKRNRRNVQIFIKNGGKQLIKKYMDYKGVKRCLISTQQSVDQFCKTDVEEIKSETEDSDVDDKTDCSKDEEMADAGSNLNEVREVEEMSSEEEDENVPGSPCPVQEGAEVSDDANITEEYIAEKQAMEELDRVIARTNLRKKERNLRKSLEARNSKVNDDVPKSTPVKAFVNILRKLSWSK